MHRVTSFTIVFFFSFCVIIFKARAQAATDINYDEAKVPPYTLPDALRRPDGQRVRTATEWTNKQRPYLLQLFAQNVYGKMPGKPKGQHFKILSVDSAALGGKAIRKQVTIYFSPQDTSASMDVLLYLPKQVTGKVPLFTGLNFGGNHTIQTDTGILLSKRWIANNDEYKSVNNRATEASRGVQMRRWPVNELITAGFGLATAYYGDLEPDYREGWKTGIRTTLQTALQIKPEEWSAIGAWAWGLSRIMDYLETEPTVDAQRVIITGHSRLGKAALWAAANDTRFAMIFSNDSGEGGAALSRRWYGETIQRINTSFPHWFVAAYKKYNNHPEQLPVDQHMLLALMAPRPLYVASAVEDQWADPKGEFLSAKHAEPVYALFGKKGLGVDEMPGLNEPVGATIRYHIRSGKHDMLPYDWEQYIKFAKEELKR
ncbi:MAG: acetylxylan esterase [Flavisolibacter sp.]|nr:acetylxylan esterase [Flavisolibacter sp.]